MTERQWLYSTDIHGLMAHAEGKATGRKLRLFAASCCRSGWHLLANHPMGREAVETAERFADGLATSAEVAASSSSMRQAWESMDDADREPPTPAGLSHEEGEVARALLRMARLCLEIGSPDSEKLGNSLEIAKRWHHRPIFQTEPSHKAHEAVWYATEAGSGAGAGFGGAAHAADAMAAALLLATRAGVGSGRRVREMAGATARIAAGTAGAFPRHRGRPVPARRPRPRLADADGGRPRDGGLRGAAAPVGRTGLRSPRGAFRCPR